MQVSIAKSGRSSVDCHMKRSREGAQDRFVKIKALFPLTKLAMVWASATRRYAFKPPRDHELRAYNSVYP